MSKITYTLDV